MTVRRAALLIVVAALAAMLAACGGSSSSTPPAISIAFTPQYPVPGSLSITAPGNTTPLAATVTNGPQNALVNWTVSCGSGGQCGGFSNTTIASGVPTTYTAPSTVPSQGYVTVTATSADNSSASVSAKITINQPAISVTFTSGGTPPGSMLISGTASLAATVANDPNNAGVNWTVACNSAQCGGFSPTHTASGATTQFTAPAAVPQNPSTVTITAASVTNPNAFVQATITITSNITLAFTPGFLLPTTPMNTNSQVQIAVTITNDPNSDPEVTWSCTPVSQCGTFDPTATGNMVATTYTAPLAVPTGNTVTVTGTSVSDFNQKVSGTITITQPPTTLPNGTYVFQLSGVDNNQQSPFNVAGAFTMQSGAIIGGEQDFVDLTFEGSDEIYRDSNTTITPTADGNLQIVLDTGDSSIGPIVDGVGDGLETLNVALVTSTTGLVTWFDGFAAGSGTIAFQNSIAAQTLPQNGYAFVASGTDNSSGAAPVAMGGVIDVDDLNSTTGTISGTGSVLDINDGSATAPEPDQPLAASAVTGPTGASTPDQYGKVVFTLNPNANPAVPEIAFAGYIIDANTIALVEIADDFGGTTGGTALAQGSKTGKFNTVSLSGSGYVVGAQGADDFFFLNFAGALTFNSDGSSVSGTADFNDQNTESSGSVAGTYSVDSAGISARTGRVTITNFTGTDLNYNPTTDAPEPATLQLYLDGKGNALLATMDLYDFTAGPAFQQTAGASLSGTYALSGTGVSFTCFNNWSAVGSINIGSSGTIGSGSFTDFDYLVTTPPLSGCDFATSTYTDVSLTGTASTPNGPITGLGADSIAAGPPLTSNTFDFFVIDGLRAFGIETDGVGIDVTPTQTGLLYLQAPPTPKAQAKTHK